MDASRLVPNKDERAGRGNWEEDGSSQANGIKVPR